MHRLLTALERQLESVERSTTDAFFAMAPGDIDRAYVADSLVFAAVTSIVWWFGDRAPKKSSR